MGQFPKNDTIATTLGAEFVFFNGVMVLHHILSHLLNTKNHLGYRGQSPKNDAIATTLGAKFVFLMGLWYYCTIFCHIY